MSTFNFEPDELIDITLKGVRVRDLQPRGEQWLAGDLGGFSITLPMGAPGLTAERAAPAEWPPQVRDLWRDADGDLWLACDDDHGIALVCSSGAATRTAEQLTKFGPLTLVRREEQS